jgi:hypothetical protein
MLNNKVSVKMDKIDLEEKDESSRNRPKVQKILFYFDL